MPCTKILRNIVFNDRYSNKKPNSPWPNLANGITKIKGHTLALVYNIMPTGTQLSKISYKKSKKQRTRLSLPIQNVDSPFLISIFDDI